jgi:hypothetical protein
MDFTFDLVVVCNQCVDGGGSIFLHAVGTVCACLCEQRRCLCVVEQILPGLLDGVADMLMATVEDFVFC